MRKVDITETMPQPCPVRQPRRVARMVIFQLSLAPAVTRERLRVSSQPKQESYPDAGLFLGFAGAGLHGDLPTAATCPLVSLSEKRPDDRSRAGRC